MSKLGLDRCYNNGQQAWAAGKLVTDCPYPLLSLEESYWVRGWHNAGVSSRRRIKTRPEPEQDSPGFDLIEGEGED